MKIFVCCKIEAVLYIYNQASLLFVCGHFSHKGNRRFAVCRSCFAPTQVKHFWELCTSVRAAEVFVLLGLVVE